MKHPLTPEEYTAAVKACPRLMDNCYIVGRRRGNKLAVVPPAVLTDRYAVERLSYASTKRRLAGCTLVQL